jgi:putative FmdB family regulatory protein
MTMPIFDYSCEKCGHYWENIEVWESHKPAVCPKCQTKEIKKIFTSSKQEIRIGKIETTPDPQPPLTELKPRDGSESGMTDLPRTELKDYIRSKDKYGNSVWKEKRRTYFHPGMGSRKSSAEKE